MEEGILTSGLTWGSGGEPFIDRVPKRQRKNFLCLCAHFLALLSFAAVCHWANKRRAVLFKCASFVS